MLAFCFEDAVVLLTSSQNNILAFKKKFISSLFKRFAVHCIELTVTSVSRAPLVHQSDCTFLLEMFEETLLPAFLVG